MGGRPITSPPLESRTLVWIRANDEPGEFLKEAMEDDGFLAHHQGILGRLEMDGTITGLFLFIRILWSTSLTFNSNPVATIGAVSLIWSRRALNSEHIEPVSSTRSEMETHRFLTEMRRWVLARYPRYVPIERQSSGDDASRGTLR